MRKLNIALIGYGFMGRAHSNAWRQVGSFFDVPCEPVLKVICGRNESELLKAANNFGWQEHSTSWEEVVAREDIDVVDICTCRCGSEEDHFLRKASRQHSGRSQTDAGSGSC
jgi:predicted dehydrogenase